MHSKAFLFPNLCFSLVSAVLILAHIALKNSKKNYISTFICCLCPFKEVRSKTKHKRRYKEEKSWRFVFEETSFLVFFALVLGLFMPYSLGVLIWYFYQTFVIMYNEFWLRFKPQIPPTRFAINFLFIIAKAERKVRLCVKLFEFFPRWILIRLTWNLSRFVPNSIEIPTWNFKKIILEKIFINFVQTKTIFF